MNTPLEEIIERFKKGSEIHQAQMDDKETSTIAKNRASYLRNHCDAVVAIATGLLPKEEENIVNAYNSGNDIPPCTGGQEYFNDKFKKV